MSQDPQNPNDPRPYGQQPGQPAGQQPYGPPASQQSDELGGVSGFFRALFDFNFHTFITPKIVKIVYVIGTVFVGLFVLSLIISGLVSLTGDGAAPVLGLLLIVAAPIIGIIYLALFRMSLELYYAVIRMSEDIHGGSHVQR